MDDPISSPTRKRPRLDTSVSPDMMSSAPDAGARETSVSPKGTIHGGQKEETDIRRDTTQQTNAVILHLRPQQSINIDHVQDKSTDAPEASKAPPPRDIAVMSKDQQTVHSQRDLSEAQKEDPRQDSLVSEPNSPVIEITEPEYINDEQQAAVIRVDGEEGDGVLGDAIVSQFPLADRYGHVGAVQRITKAVRDGKVTTFALLKTVD